MDMNAEQIKLLLDTGKSLAAPIRRDNGDVVIPVPNGTTLQTLPRIAPDHVTQTVSIDDDASFVSYVSAFKLPGQTALFAQAAGGGGLTAIIDYHRANTVSASSGDSRPTADVCAAQVGHCAHKVLYAFRTSFAYQAWQGVDRRLLEQSDFAEFLEENGVDVISPDAATLAELVNDLGVTRVTAIKKKINLSNGCVELQVEEGDSASSNGKALVVPKQIMIRIPLFDGGETFDFPLVFRYRFSGGKLSFEVRFVRADDILKRATIAKIEALAKEVGLSPIYGGIR